MGAFYFVGTFQRKKSGFMRFGFLVLFLVSIFFNLYATNNTWQSFPGITSYVNKAVTDHQGVIWFATYNGVYRYNYHELINYNINNSPLLNNIINDLVVDADNVIWMATNDGLFTYDEGFWWHYTENNSFLVSNWVRLLELDQNIHLYVYMAEPYHTGFRTSEKSSDPDRYDHQILMVDLSNLTLVNWLSFWQPVTVLSVDNNNDLWFNKRDSAIFPADPPFMVLMDAIVRFDGVVLYYMDDLSDMILYEDRMINVIHPYSDGLWFGTGYNTLYGRTSYSLFFYEEGEITVNYGTSNSDLPNQDVTAVLQTDDTLWIGTEDGLAKVVNDEWSVYTTGNSSLPSNEIKQIFTDSDSRVWFVTENGLAVYGEELNVQDPVSELPSIQISASSYPNPYRIGSVSRQAEGISIKYQVSQKTEVRIDIFNIKGQQLRQFKEGWIEKGEHTIFWQGDDRSGKAVPPGVYFYRISTNNACHTGKMLLIR